jgi:hypothetical protein
MQLLTNIFSALSTNLTHMLTKTMSSPSNKTTILPIIHHDMNDDIVHCIIQIYDYDDLSYNSSTYASSTYASSTYVSSTYDDFYLNCPV